MQHRFCALSIVGKICRSVLLTDPLLSLIGSSTRHLSYQIRGSYFAVMRLGFINIPIVELILVGIPTIPFFFSSLSLTSLSLAPLFAECSGRSCVRR
jgi:hypothetical protein